MSNKITQKLIVLFGAVIFSFALSNSASANVFSSGVNSDCRINSFSANGVTSLTVTSGSLVTLSWNTYGCSGVNLNGSDVNSNVNQTGYFNINPTTSSSYTLKATDTNYYTQYQTVKIKVIPSQTTTSVNTSNTTSKSATKATTKQDDKSEVSKNDLTALSLRGDGGFMPSSIWQWILVVILILAIIIIGRMFVHKPQPGEHDQH